MSAEPALRDPYFVLLDEIRIHFDGTYTEAAFGQNLRLRPRERWIGEASGNLRRRIAREVQKRIARWPD